MEPFSPTSQHLYYRLWHKTQDTPNKANSSNHRPPDTEQWSKRCSTISPLFLYMQSHNHCCQNFNLDHRIIQSYDLKVADQSRLGKKLVLGSLWERFWVMGTWEIPIQQQFTVTVGASAGEQIMLFMGCQDC